MSDKCVFLKTGTNILLFQTFNTIVKLFQIIPIKIENLSNFKNYIFALKMQQVISNHDRA